MDPQLNEARENFIQGMSRISHFWGFPKAMGAIYGAIYLSPSPMTLDDLVEQVGVSKGAVSTNARALERLGIIHKQVVLGDRKDYYVAEPDFWKVIRGVLQEREKSEFDKALRTVDESLNMVKTSAGTAADPELTAFYQERLQAMKGFFNTLDSMVSTLVALDELRMGSLPGLFARAGRKSEK